MSSVHEKKQVRFNELAEILWHSPIGCITPMQVLQHARQINDSRVVRVLSQAFEEVPGFSTKLIRFFLKEFQYAKNESRSEKEVGGRTKVRRL